MARRRRYAGPLSRRSAITPTPAITPVWRPLARGWQSGRLQRVLAAAAFVAGCLVLAHRLWMPPLGTWLVVADDAPTADALAPLAGDRERVAFAAALLKQNSARWFVITDMWVDASSPPGFYAGLIQRQAAAAGVPLERVVLTPGTVSSTYQEARNLRELARQRGWRLLLVVTSPYHTRRARLILRDAFAGTGVTVAVRPVVGSWYRAELWWQSWPGWRSTLSEYGKLALYWAGYRQ